MTDNVGVTTTGQAQVYKWPNQEPYPIKDTVQMIVGQGAALPAIGVRAEDAKDQRGVLRLG